MGVIAKETAFFFETFSVVEPLHDKKGIALLNLLVLGHLKLSSAINNWKVDPKLLLRLLNLANFHNTKTGTLSILRIEIK